MRAVGRGGGVSSGDSQCGSEANDWIEGVNFGFMELASVRASFLLPALCFVEIAAYGLWVSRTARRAAV